MSNTALALAAPAAFRPSPNQRRLLDYIHEHPSFHTIHELCAAAGIGRTTYYAWCQSPAFRLWLAQAWSARLLMDGAVLLNHARVQATRSFSYWKALADLTFDPKGLGILQKWQQACAQADPAAFEPPPEENQPENTPSESPEPTPGAVRSLSESNQALAPKNGTNRPLSPAAPATAPQPRPHHSRGTRGCERRSEHAWRSYSRVRGATLGPAPIRRSNGLRLPGPQAGVSISGTRGEATLGPAPIKVARHYQTAFRRAKHLHR